MVISSKGTGESSAGAVAFSCNRSMPLNLRHSSGSFDYSHELETFVFASKTGSLSFISNVFEFEVENSIDGAEFRNVLFSSHFGIVVTLSSKNVQVWDIFREVVGMRVKPIHVVAVPSKPKSLHILSDNVCLIGLDSGKLMVMDLPICTTGLPRFACAPYLEVCHSSLTAITSYNLEYIIVGTDDGTIKIIKYDSKKIVSSIKAPANVGGSVSSITVFGCGSSIPNFAVSFTNTNFITVHQNGVFSYTVNTSVPALCAFVQPEAIFVHLSDSTLVRHYGTKWALASVESRCCIGSRVMGEKLWYLQLDMTTCTTVLKTRPPTSIMPGSLSLTSLGRFPAVSVSFSSSALQNNQMDVSHLIRLCNDFTNWKTDEGCRFVYEWNDKKWEGIIVSAFNSPSEIVFSIYSHTTQRVLGIVSVEGVPDLSVITAIDLSCVEKDRWNIFLGFSSGKIGQINSVRNDEGVLVWSALNLLVSPVHEGARISHVGKSVLGGQIVVSVDVEGMVCFTRLATKNCKTDTNAHVAIAGEGGLCVIDSKNSLAYICMSGGTIERMKTPKKRSDGLEDIHDSDVWEAHTIVESLPIDGPFVAFFPIVGCAVLVSGICIFSSWTVKRTIRLNKIFDAKVCIVGQHTFIVVLAETSVCAYDIVDGTPVFQRSHETEFPTSIPAFLTESFHYVKWGVSITSILFADRVKDIINGETVITAAQRFYKFPPIQSAPLEVFEKESSKNSAENTANSGTAKKGFFSKMFKKSKSPKDESLGGDKLKQYLPTEQHLQEARKQLAANLDAMARLRDNAAEMENSSSDFLKLATELNTNMKKPEKKRFGFF